MLYTACERNTCNNVTCFNGGSCNSGECRCPTGYEGSQCQTLSVARFIGVYGGYSQCGYDGANNGGAPQVTDTAWITGDQKNVNFVYVTYKSLLPRVLHGYVSNSVSTYSIIFPLDSNINQTEKFTLTLQSDSKLIIDNFSRFYNTTSDTIVDCTFKGTKD